ncbi:MAG: hypothetical protein ACLU3F_00305 [Blautia wexlerae]
MKKKQLTIMLGAMTLALLLVYCSSGTECGSGGLPVSIQPESKAGCTGACWYY